MGESTDGVELEALHQAALDKDAFDTLYRAAFEVRRRLELVPGTYFFNLDDPQYSKVEVAAIAYDHLYVTLHVRPEQVGVSTSRGIPYMLGGFQGISKQKDGNLSYSTYDQLTYESKYREGSTYDEELDIDGDSYDFSTPLPEKVRGLLEKINRILPSLILEQLIEEESEEYPIEEYDQKRRKELKEIEQALSTAGGALYLLRLALSNRYSSGDLLQIQPKEFALPTRRLSTLAISAYLDTLEDHNEGDDIDWEETLIELKRPSLSGGFQAYSTGTRFKHSVIYTLSSHEGEIEWEMVDRLERDGDTFVTDIDYSRASFQPEQTIPEDLLSVVEIALKEIIASATVS